MTKSPDGLSSVERQSLLKLIAIGVISWALYVVIAVLSARFSLDVPSAERPHLMFFGLFVVLFGLYLTAVRLAVCVTSVKPVLLVIVLFAVAFRFVLLPTTPIQEIDLYRYVWDGHVSQALVSPYRFSPQQIITAADQARGGSDGSHVDPQLWDLVEAQRSDPALGQIIRTVHYGELTTPYPPVSQAVFALSAALTPRGASVSAHLLVMKSLIVLFDLGILLAMIGILRRVGMPVGWCAAYAWCPLVMKEFANSSHLDAIAVFLTTLGIWLLLTTSRRALWGMAVLGLGVGAKLYPLILTPLCFAMIVRRDGWRRALLATGALVVVSAIALAPMIWTLEREPSRDGAARLDHQDGLPPLPTLVDSEGTVAPPLPTETDDPETQPSGLRAFLIGWKMNEFLFLLLSENLNPANEEPRDQTPWFVILPHSARQWIAQTVASTCGVDAETGAFLLARATTLCVFGLLVLTWCARLMLSQETTRRPEDAGALEMQFLEAAFLTLAWFWLLSPTQNPWYWTWALPLIPFARSRVWLWVAGVVMTYYLRFWFVAHWPESPGPLGSRYSGGSFFDFVISWAEFGPLLICLTIDAWRRSSLSR